ncbi:co-chaperone HscB [Rheinheimera maricola]|uniref:Co-chaperone protein HscB homolog n=1 Tax=Rheinheimera maricola TaxID=2793282 RepID=A0ABS7X8B7_9GAMM|nr:co-chaperone HscB [Rheinheimera maricola]MBZ9611405.1 co-chaperone HscB [Rheinheimera maricola]
MNYFQLFNLPATFELDLTELGSRYLKLQKQFHPDQHSSGSERDKLLAVQQTANINDAYHSLKQPLLRAEHLLALRGLKISHEQRSFTDPQFLMQQMELREQLADIDNSADPDAVIDSIDRQLQQQKNALLKQLGAALVTETSEQDQLAADLIRKLKFFFKLQQELELIEQQLQD